MSYDRLREVMPPESTIDLDDHAERINGEVERVRARQRRFRFDAKGKCLASGKRPYKSKMTALLHNAGRPVMARAYQCEWCGRWHLTRRDQT